MSRPLDSRKLARRALGALLAIGLSVGVAATAQAVRRPIQIRLEGHLDSAPEGVRPIRTIVVQIGKSEQRSIAVTKIVNLSHGPLGATLLDEAARYKPSLRLTGDEAMLRGLQEAKAGTFVKILGNLSANRYVLVSQVEVGT